MIRKGSIIKNEIREKINIVENEHNLKLSTIQKILLTIRGPITTVLDVLYGEVHLFMLNQSITDADDDIAGLIGVNRGEEILIREAIVHKNGHPLVYALSYIPTSRCTVEILEDLRREELTTGKIIDKHNQETSRELKKITIEEATPTLTELFKTSEKMLSREYIMIRDKKPIIWTKELYPISYFREDKLI